MPSFKAPKLPGSPRLAAILGILALFVVVAVVAGTPYVRQGVENALLAESEAKPAEKVIDPPAPLFTLSDVNGRSVSLTDFRGKWVFINFWASWCGPCVVEMPLMEKLNQTMKNDPFVMLAISLDDAEPVKIRQFAKELGVSFSVLMDTANVAREYGVTSIPATFVVNPDGLVVAQAQGAREWDNPEMVKFFRDMMETAPKKD
ncbi:MAG: TlpA family protein disulfide reductase [Nitrospinae bacterium]|nr:TlpA family protein disulfide reductase [Nitrospinota bacterium]